jgi:hypothetical protein
MFKLGGWNFRLRTMRLAIFYSNLVLGFRAERPVDRFGVANARFCRAAPLIRHLSVLSTRVNPIDGHRIDSEAVASVAASLIHTSGRKQAAERSRS